MTLTERYQWAYGTAVILTTAVYAVWLAIQLSQRPAAQIEFTRALLITQRGDALTFYVFSGLAAVPLALGLADVDPFWITNSLFFAFALAAVFGIVAKTALYGHHLKEH